MTNNKKYIRVMGIDIRDDFHQNRKAGENIFDLIIGDQTFQVERVCASGVVTRDKVAVLPVGNSEPTAIRKLAKEILDASIVHTADGEWFYDVRVEIVEEVD